MVFGALMSTLAMLMIGDECGDRIWRSNRFANRINEVDSNLEGRIFLGIRPALNNQIYVGRVHPRQLNILYVRLPPNGTQTLRHCLV